MAVDSKALTAEAPEGSSYQLDINQVQRAADALLGHIKKSRSELGEQSTKRSLLPADADSSDEEDSPAGDREPVWLILTTKKHVVDKKRLKPGKITLPHPLHNLSATVTSPIRVCLITADPQRAYKDIVTSPAFPSHLKPCISRVIGISKLKAKYKSFESRRQLAAQHDLFLADDRVIPMLPATLGKVFYKGGEKRPVPVELSGNKNGRAKAELDSLGQKKKRKLAEGESKGSVNVGTPQEVAREIEQALKSALVHLSASVTTAIKVAHAGMEAGAVSDNIEAVCKEVIDKYVPQKWNNVRAVHVKGPNTMALPIWLASELWVGEEDVLDEPWKPQDSEKSKTKKLKGSKRKLLSAGEGDQEVADEDVASKKKRRPDVADEEQPAKKAKTSTRADLDREVAMRKEALRKQKERVRGDAPEETTDSKKRAQDMAEKPVRAPKKAKIDQS